MIIKKFHTADDGRRYWRQKKYDDSLLERAKRAARLDEAIARIVSSGESGPLLGKIVAVEEECETVWWWAFRPEDVYRRNCNKKQPTFKEIVAGEKIVRTWIKWSCWPLLKKVTTVKVKVLTVDGLTETMLIDLGSGRRKPSPMVGTPIYLNNPARLLKNYANAVYAIFRIDVSSTKQGQITLALYDFFEDQLPSQGFNNLGSWGAWRDNSSSAWRNNTYLNLPKTQTFLWSKDIFFNSDYFSFRTPTNLQRLRDESDRLWSSLAKDQYQILLNKERIRLSREVEEINRRNKEAVRRIQEEARRREREVENARIARQRAHETWVKSLNLDNLTSDPREPYLFLLPSQWKPLKAIGLAQARVATGPSYTEGHWQYRMGDGPRETTYIPGRTAPRGLTFLGERTKISLNKPLVLGQTDLKFIESGEVCMVIIADGDACVYVYSPILKEEFDCIVYGTQEYDDFRHKAVAGEIHQRVRTVLKPFLFELYRRYMQASLPGDVNHGGPL